MRPRNDYMLLLLALARIATGCTTAHTPGQHTITLPSQRPFVLYVPQTAPTGLLVHMHGCGTLNTTQGLLVDNPDYEILLSRMNGVAGDDANFMIAYPIGMPSVDGSCTSIDGSIPLGFNAGVCCGGTGADDVSYIRDIVGYVSDRMCAKEGSVFASGFSNGAMMAHRLGCEAADIFTGFAAIEGNLMLGNGFETCAPSRPVSVLMMCGDADLICRFTYKSTISTWRSLLECTGDPVISLSTATSSCMQYQACNGNSTLEYCTTKKIGHCWPGEVEGLRLGICTPEPPTNINATTYIVDKFQAM